jgi:nucleoside 2-deoxyribosyltransferase
MNLDQFFDKVSSLLKISYYKVNTDNINNSGIIFRDEEKIKILANFQLPITLLIDENLDKDFLEKLHTLFYNGTFPADGFYELQRLKDFVATNFPNLHPDQKVVVTLNYLQSLMSYDGSEIGFDTSQLVRDEVWRKVYLRNFSELEFYLGALLQLNYITYQRAMGAYLQVQLTIKGLSFIIQENEKKNSRYCFVAMSFDTDLFGAYEEGILPAIIKTGYEPIIVRKEEKIPSDVTINDAILAAIKRSKFTIADFTRHKRGVYFEAGYALGRQQKVIYTCKEDDIENAHFDTRNYSHILWKDPGDLRSQLINKIEVYINS